MSYKVNIKNIYLQHCNAWDALFGGEYSGVDNDETVKQYHKKYHAKLISDMRQYTHIEFDTESDYVLFMMEWS